MDKILRTTREIASLVDGVKLEEFKLTRFKPKRIAILIDLLRDAVNKSSLCLYNGKIHAFNGQIYEPFTTPEFENMVYEIFKELGGTWKDMFFIDPCIKTLRRVVSSKPFVLDGSKVVFRNCSYDFKKRGPVEFSPDVHQLTQASFDYDPLAMCPIWKAFLQRVLPDKTQQDILQEFFGALFVDRKHVKIEKMLILKGGGSNGKSVVFNTITGILGEQNVSNFSPHSLTYGQEKKRNVATLNGKRLNYCSEMRTQSFTKDGDSLKTLISGEPIEARAMYSDNFMARDIPLLVANSNQLPEMDLLDNALKRRFLIIPFNVTIKPSEQNPNLSDDLRSEYSGIFNWIVEGYDRFKANGYKFTESRVTEKEIELSGSGTSVVKTFMFDKINYYPQRNSIEQDVEPLWTKAISLYARYKEWCVSNTYNLASMKKFFQELQVLGYERRVSGGSTYYGVYGIKAERDAIVNGAARPKKKVGRGSPRDGKVRAFFEDGEKWIETYIGIADYFGLSYIAVSKLMKAKKLEGCYKVDKRTTIFNIKSTQMRLMELKVLISDDEKLRDQEDAEILRVIRASFNKDMKRLKLPYRKFAIKENQDPKYVVVPDNWEYTEENVRKLNNRTSEF